MEKEYIINALKGFNGIPPHVIQYRMILRGIKISLDSLTSSLEEMVEKKEIIGEINPRDNGDWKFLYSLR